MRRKSSSKTTRIKNFTIKERYRLAAPGSALNSATFGVITATVNNPRVIQLALKLNF